MVPALILVNLLAASSESAALKHGKGSSFPLAAALVHRNRLYLVDVPSRTARLVPLPDLIPEEADLSQDKKLIAVNARSPKGKAPYKLFLVKVGDWTLDEVKADAAGDYRFPHFSADGQFLYFSAAHADAQGGPANPLRIHRLKLAGRATEEVETQAGHCEFSPTPIGTTSIAHIGTSCTVVFDLEITDLTKRVVTSSHRVQGPTTEIAASPDGKRLVQVGAEQRGLGFYLVTSGGKLTRIAGITNVATKRVQPRFICPRDVVFIHQNKVWALDTKSSELTELLKLPDIPSGEGTAQ